MKSSNTKSTEPKFTAPGSSLSGALAKVLPAAPDRPMHPIEGFVLIEAEQDSVTLTCFNPASGIRKSSSFEATVDRAGATTAHAKGLSEIAPHLSGDVTIEVSASKLRASVERSGIGQRLYEGFALDPADFPKAGPSIDASFGIELPGSALATGIERVRACASTDQTPSRSALTGITVRKRDGGLDLMACDGRRLAVHHLPDVALSGEVPDQFTIPMEAAEDILRNAATSPSVRVNSDGKGAVIDFGGESSTTCRLGEQKPPNLEAAIPKKFSLQATLPRETFADSIAAIAAVNRSGAIHIDCDGRNVKLAGGVTADNFSTEISGSDHRRVIDHVKVESSDPIKVTVSLPFLQAAVRGIATENVLIMGNSPSEAIVVAPEGDTDRASWQVIMPIMRHGTKEAADEAPAPTKKAEKVASQEQPAPQPAPKAPAQPVVPEVTQASSVAAKPEPSPGDGSDGIVLETWK